MKSLIETFSRARKKIAIAFLILCALIAILGSTITPALADVTGTYVAPRVYTLYSGTVTTNQNIVITPLTNLLNYSGYHSIKLFLTVLNTNATSAGSNVIASLNFSPGSGNGYTNAVLGTNLVYTTGYPFSWTNTVPGLTNSVFYTDLPQSVADSIAVMSGKITTTDTNPTFIQLDAAVTP